MAGLRNDEVPSQTGSLVAALHAADDFLIDPLPNLLFTRDSSVWVGDRATVTALAMPARRRETQLTELIYQFHPRFVGTQRIHGWDKELLEGGDVLALAEGVLAVGVGERTRPAGAERLARTAFAEDAAQEAMIEATLRWPTAGVPDSPGAWLTTTARRKAIDRIRRERRPHLVRQSFERLPKIRRLRCDVHPD